MQAPSWYRQIKKPSIVVPAVSGALVGFLLAMLIFGQPWHLPPNWGDIPTWLATIAATAAGIVAYRVYRIEASRDDVADKDRRSAQAAKVGAWYGSREGQMITTPIGTSVQTQTSRERIWGAFLRNASDLPVFDVVVMFYFGKASLDEADANTSPYKVLRTVLPPGNEPVHVKIPDEVLRLFGSADSKEIAFYRVKIEFTDSAGIRWRR